MNPVYVAKTVLGGKEYAGAHEPIVDQATWDKVQRMIAERRTTGGRGGARSTRRFCAASSGVGPAGRR